MREPLPQPLSVVLVDDHLFFRRGLRDLLQSEGVEVVGEAGDGRLAVQLVTELRPDVVVMDLNMPNMDGIEATAALRRGGYRGGVLVLTTSSAEESLIDAVLAGASGYVLKDAGVEDMVAGVRTAAEGQATLSPQVATRLMERVRDQGADAPADDHVELSGREIEVLSLLARGSDNNEIAGQLHLSPSTVKNYLSSLMDKIGVDNRVQAAVWAVRRGFD